MDPQDPFLYVYLDMLVVYLDISPPQSSDKKKDPADPYKGGSTIGIPLKGSIGPIGTRGPASPWTPWTPKTIILDLLGPPEAPGRVQGGPYLYFLGPGPPIPEIS